MNFELKIGFHSYIQCEQPVSSHNVKEEYKCTVSGTLYIKETDHEKNFFTHLLPQNIIWLNLLNTDVF